MYCDYFNELGKRCQQNGMKFGYHNHAHEFQKVENKAVMLDYMIEMCIRDRNGSTSFRF